MAKPRGAGALDKRITFQKVTRSRSASGADVETWADNFERWAQYAPKGSREFFEVQQRWAEVHAVFVIRYESCRPVSDLFANPEDYRIVYAHSCDASPINYQIFDIV